MMNHKISEFLAKSFVIIIINLTLNTDVVYLHSFSKKKIRNDINADIFYIFTNYKNECNSNRLHLFIFFEPFFVKKL